MWKPAQGQQSWRDLLRLLLRPLTFMFPLTPGGKKVLLKACGQDSSEKFWQFHSQKVLDKTAKPFLIGKGMFRSSLFAEAAY